MINKDIIEINIIKSEHGVAECDLVEFIFDDNSKVYVEMKDVRNLITKILYDKK